MAAAALEENFVVLAVPFFEREVLVFLRSGARCGAGKAGLLGRQKAAGPGWAAVPETQRPWLFLPFFEFGLAAELL